MKFPAQGLMGRGRALSHANQREEGEREARRSAGCPLVGTGSNCRQRWRTTSFQTGFYLGFPALLLPLVQSQDLVGLA